MAFHIPVYGENQVSHNYFTMVHRALPKEHHRALGHTTRREGVRLTPPIHFSGQTFVSLGVWSRQ